MNFNSLWEKGYTCDLVTIHPGASSEIYGPLDARFTAIEPPLWVRLISGYAMDQGFSVRIIDAEAETKDSTQVAADVFLYRPRLVCIVAFGHQPSASTQQMYAAGQIAKAIRATSPARIILVGGHVSSLAEETLLADQYIDYVCKGEGPETVVGLLRGDDKQNIPGLGYFHSSLDDVLPKINEPAPLIDLEKMHGNVWQLLPMARYRAHNWQCLDGSARQPYASVYTSLGCPYKCHFCCISAPFGGNRYRMRSPEAVVQEICMLHRRYGVKTFKIIDEMFVLNERHYTAICNGLIESGISDELNIWAYARVDTIKPPTLLMFRRAGFRWLALGIESGSKYVRDGAQKRLKNDDIATVVKSIHTAGINVIGNFIFGLPDDDLETMQETLALAQDLNCEWANFYSAMAYPGSPLYTQAKKEGWRLPENWSGYSQHSEDCRPLDTYHISGAMVLRFRDEAFIKYFSSPRYQHMIAEKFGDGSLLDINQMLEYRLPRKLLRGAVQ